MSKLSTLVLSVSLLTSSAFAADRLECTRVGEGKGALSLAIEIAENTVTTTSLDKVGTPSQVWNRVDPGLFSYWGTDDSKVRETNERFLTHVRIAIDGRKTLNQIPAKSNFTMEVALIWESLYFETSGIISEDRYSCQKL